VRGHQPQAVRTGEREPGDDGPAEMCDIFGRALPLQGAALIAPNGNAIGSRSGGTEWTQTPPAANLPPPSCVAGGDRAALRVVYQDTSAKLFGVCLRILKDRGEAEDVLQEVFVTVWRRAASFDPGRASPITWMVAIARNRAIDRLRASAVSRRMEPIESADAVSDPAPAAVERVELAQQHQRLSRCLEELEARHASAIRAAFLDGTTYEELAARMSVPLGTMKSWIRRGLLKLRTCLEA